MSIINIFALDRNAHKAAEFHCDRHVVKMIVEYAQLLSTAHRMLDGNLHVWQIPIDNGRIKTLRFWELDGEISKPTWFTDIFGRAKYSVDVQFRKCYNVTHFGHPCAVWARQTDLNYFWLVSLFEGVLNEYEKRYQKIHATKKLLPFFRTAPKNIKNGGLTRFALAMPDQYKVDDEILSYQNYYVGDKARFARWTNTTVPKWFADRVGTNEAYFTRAH